MIGSYLSALFAVEVEQVARGIRLNETSRALAFNAYKFTVQSVTEKNSSLPMLMVGGLTGSLVLHGILSAVLARVYGCVEVHIVVANLLYRDNLSLSHPIEGR